MNKKSKKWVKPKFSSSEGIDWSVNDNVDTEFTNQPYEKYWTKLALGTIYKNKINVHHLVLSEKLFYPRNDEGKITDGTNKKKLFESIKYSTKDNYFSRPKDFIDKKDSYSIWGDESLNDLIDYVNEDLNNFDIKLIFIFETLNILFPNRTRKLFEHFKNSNKVLYNGFKKRHLDILKHVGNYKGDIQFELENEGLIGSNIFLRVLTRSMYKLSNSARPAGKAPINATLIIIIIAFLAFVTILASSFIYLLEQYS